LEPLEARDVPAAINVNFSHVVRAVNKHDLGVNATWWDTNLNTAQTAQMVKAAGLSMFRFPGGSSSDSWHFANPPTYSGEGTTPSMAEFIASVKGGGHGDSRLRLSQSPGSRCLARLSERLDQQHDSHRYGRAMGSQHQHLGAGGLKDGRLLGQSARGQAAEPGRWPQLPSPGT
jgi:hypothetical protein